MKQSLKLNLAISTVKKALDVVHSLIQQQNFSIQLKANKGFLTQVDLESNQVICDCLKSHSNYPILSEENKDDLARLQANRVWVVDPLDGTKEFVEGRDDFTINIALIEKCRPILGIIAVPAQNTIYYAEKGGGAYCINGDKTTKICVSTRSFLKRAKLLLSRSHLDAGLQSVLSHHPSIGKKMLGSALKYCLIANGQADASIRKTPIYEWDIAAGDCILTEAGGSIITFDGKKLQYNQKTPLLTAGIIATNNVLEMDFYKLIKEGLA